MKSKRSIFLVMVTALLAPICAAMPALADTPPPMSFLDRGIALLGDLPAHYSIEQSPPVFAPSSAGRLALAAYYVPEVDKSVLIAHSIPGKGAAGAVPMFAVFDGHTPTGDIDTYTLAYDAPTAPVTQAATIVASGPGDVICNAAAAGVFWTVVKIIKFGSGPVGAIVGSVLGAYVCSMAHSPEPFGDAITLSQYGDAPNSNEVAFAWSAPGPDYQVIGEYHLKSKVCVPNPAAFNNDCYGVNTSGYYKSSTVFYVDAWWPDGSYSSWQYGTGSTLVSATYNRTFYKNPGAYQGDYVTGFSVSEAGYISGDTVPTGAARHHVVVTA